MWRVLRLRPSPVPHSSRSFVLVLQKIFAFSTTHNFSSSIATRCESCGPRPHGNGGSSSRGSLLWRLPWELALLQGHGGGVGVGPGWGLAAPSPGCYLDRPGVLPGLGAPGCQWQGCCGKCHRGPRSVGRRHRGAPEVQGLRCSEAPGQGRRGPGEACGTRDTGPEPSSHPDRADPGRGVVCLLEQGLGGRGATGWARRVGVPSHCHLTHRLPSTPSLVRALPSLGLCPSWPTLRLCSPPGSQHSLVPEGRDEAVVRRRAMAGRVPSWL